MLLENIDQLKLEDVDLGAGEFSLLTDDSQGEGVLLKGRATIDSLFRTESFDVIWVSRFDDCGETFESVASSGLDARLRDAIEGRMCELIDGDDELRANLADVSRETVEVAA